MTAIPAPVNGHWTAADLDRLDDTYRYEIVDGNVLVNASPSGRHQRIILRLAQLLEAQLPEGLLVVPDVDVVLDPENTRRPDLIVAAAELAEQERFAAEDVHLVVEVVSPGSMNADRVAKPAQYATCRIPAYWRVETKPDISIIEYRLAEGSYAQAAPATVTFMTGEPWPVKISIADLHPLRRLRS